MVGCGEYWCYEPWAWMVCFIGLKLAYMGQAGGYGGAPYDPVGGG